MYKRLKPCPKCGSHNVAIFGFSNLFPNDRAAHGKCEACGYTDSKTYNTIKPAIESWNILPRHPLPKKTTYKNKYITIKVKQNDWIPGFAAYIAKKNTVKKVPGAFSHADIVLNVGALLAAVASKEEDPKELPYSIAECTMHEIIHVLEDFFAVDFNEQRVEKLISKYRKKFGKR